MRHSDQKGIILTTGFAENLINVVFLVPHSKTWSISKFWKSFIKTFMKIAPEHGFLAIIPAPYRRQSVWVRLLVKRKEGVWGRKDGYRTPLPALLLHRDFPMCALPYVGPWHPFRKSRRISGNHHLTEDHEFNWNSKGICKTSVIYFFAKTDTVFADAPKRCISYGILYVFCVIFAPIALFTRGEVFTKFRKLH